MKLFHPTTVLGVALLLVSLLQVAVGSRFDAEARRASARGVEAGFPLDDAWIHQVYARSFAEHGRLDYNPGDAEVGQSSLLWGVLLAPVHAAADATDVPVARATRVFGIVVWIALAFAVALLVLTLPVPGAPFGALCGALLVALDPALAFAAVSGMEPLLFALLLVLAAAALVRRRFLLLGLAVGLSILARPEGLLFGGILVVAAAFRGPDPDRVEDGAPTDAPLGRFLRAAIPAALLAGIWGAYCATVAGRPFPNTWYQKVADVGLGEAFTGGLALLGGTLAGSPFFESYIGYLFLLIGVVALVSRAPRVVWGVTILLPPVAFVAVAGTRAMPDPTAFFWERYLTPMVPWLHAVTAVGYAGAGAVLLDLLRKSRRPAGDEPEGDGDDAAGTDAAAKDAPTAEAPDEDDPEATPIDLPKAPEPLLVPDVVLAIALVFVSLVPFTHAPRRLAERVTEYGANVRDVDAMNVRAGLWLRDRSGFPDGTVVASQDAGAIRYFGPYEVLDLIGLNDHRLVDAGLRDGTIGPYLQERAPEVVVLLDPDPGAVEFAHWARARGLRERARFTADAYSLFGEPIAKSIVVLAP